jgi:hypothetical protein
MSLDRREFLKMSGLIAAGFGVASCVPEFAFGERSVVLMEGSASGKILRVNAAFEAREWAVGGGVTTLEDAFKNNYPVQYLIQKGVKGGLVVAETEYRNDVDFQKVSDLFVLGETTVAEVRSVLGGSRGSGLSVSSEIVDVGASDYDNSIIDRRKTSLINHNGVLNTVMEQVAVCAKEVAAAKYNGFYDESKNSQVEDVADKFLEEVYEILGTNEFGDSL